jgi:recombination associated protein RdgC
MTFLLAEDISVKRLKFTDLVLEQNQDIDKDNIAVKLDADFVLFTSEVNTLIKDLDTAFALSADA